MRTVAKKTQKQLKELTLREKCVYALALIFLCRILSGIPTPFVNREYVKGILDNNSAFGIMNLLTGNSLSSLSIMALGITPYITASIVIQLLAVAFPKLDEMRKGMADEREKLEHITIIAGCALAAVQGAAMCVGLRRGGVFASDKWYVFGAVVFIWAMGTLVESLIGKYITDKLIGNGISLILLANILSSYPQDAYALFSVIVSGRKAAVAALLAVAAAAGIFALFAFTIYVEGCEKRLPIVYTQKSGGYNSPLIANFIPIKLCPGSVIPVIFASSLFAMPGMIAAYMGKSDVEWLRFFNTSYWFSRAYKPYYTVGALVYVLLIFGFSYYYVSIEVNPIQTSMTIKKANGFIPGVRPGRDTAEYIRKQMKFTIFIGAVALSFIAMVPIVLGGVFLIPRLSFLGTSVIITCGVIMETQKTILAEMKGKNSRKRKKRRIANGRR